MSRTRTVARSLLGLPTPEATAQLTAALSDNRALAPQLASPFAPSPDQLQTIVFADVLGGSLDAMPLDRAAAMGVPAIARMRHMLCGIIAGLPLVSLTGDVRDAAQPRWMSRTDGDLSPWHRMLWTVDDHLFYGWSLWACTRGAPTDGSPLLSVDRVPWHRWSVDTVNGEGRILVDQAPVTADRVLLLPGPHGGILNEAAGPIRMAIANLRAAGIAAQNPNPNIDLHYTGDDPMTDDDIDALISRWTERRLKQTGGVGFTSKNVEAKGMGAHNAQLLVEGRNADAVDMARIGSVPAAMLDATSAGASLTYETTEGRNRQFLDYGARLYMDAVAARLSMDDAVPRGRRTAFDVDQLTTLTPDPTGPVTED